MISIILLSCKEKSYFIYRDIETKKYKIYFYTIGNTTNASFKDSLVVYDKTKETIIFKEGSYGYIEININNEDTLKVYISYYIDDAEKINIVDKNLVIKFIKDYDKKKPRPPKFNEPGDVPGPPVQYGDPITPQTVKAGYGFIDNGIIEKNLYFYHPDHLGSSSYITDREGRITQHTEYIAFGEVLFEEHSTSKTMPYLFNGKELDQDTNLTYYGARYLDMKTSLWLNVDPLVEKTMQPYAYANNNPVRFIDPTGEFPILINGKVSNDSERASLTYWSSNILNTISDKTGYNINQFMYVDGDKSIWAYYRANLGRDFAKTQALAIYNRLKESVKDGKITEQLQVFTHSRGSAYGQGYMEGLRKEIISLAKADGLYFSYGADNLIEYSVNLAPHQSNSLFYEKSGTTNINISHYGDLLSGNDAKGNVINIHSQPPSRMKDQHGNATHNKELNMVLEVLKKGKNDIFNRIKNAYKHYDNTNQCNGCRESTVKGSN